MKNKFKIEKELWREKAACKNLDINLFFPDTERQSALSRKNNLKVKSICKKCPVQTNCIAYAMDNQIEYGMWGGFSSLERKELNKILNLKEVPTNFYNLIVNKSITAIKLERTLK
jgi:WhiB family redox-sensing transcriptional regulator